MTNATAARPPLALDVVYYAFALFFFFYLFIYFWTTSGGPTLLAMTLVPVTYVLFILSALRQNDLYPRLPPAASYAAGAVQIGLALVIGYYMHTEYYDLGTSRAGDWNSTDTPASSMTRMSSALMAAGSCPGKMRQLTLAVARWGRAFGACPPLICVATQLVCRMALAEGSLRNRSAAAASPLAAATMSAPFAASLSSLPNFWK